MVTPVISRCFSSMTSAVRTHSTAVKVAGASLVLGAGAYLFPGAVISAGASILDTARTYAPSVFGPSAAAQAAATRSLATRVADTFYSILSTGPSAAEQAAAARNFTTKVAVGIGTSILGGGLAVYTYLRNRGTAPENDRMQSLDQVIAYWDNVALLARLARQTPQVDDDFQPGDGFKKLYEQMEHNQSPPASDDEDDCGLIAIPLRTVRQDAAPAAM